MTKAPFGGAATGANLTTDRGKRGTKRSQLCDGHGLPLAIAVAGANVHDTRLVAPTLDAIVIARPEPSEEAPQHLCLDAGYVGDKTEQAVTQRTYVAHVRPRGRKRLMPVALIEQEAASLGGGTAAFLAQSLPTFAGAMGKAHPDL